MRGRASALLPLLQLVSKGIWSLEVPLFMAAASRVVQMASVSFWFCGADDELLRYEEKQ